MSDTNRIVYKVTFDTTTIKLITDVVLQADKVISTVLQTSEVIEYEKRRAKLQEWLDEQDAFIKDHLSFRESVKPAMKWLAENKDPHCKIIIESDCAELVSGEMSFRSLEFIKD